MAHLFEDTLAYKKSEHMIDINEYERVTITGNIDSYRFELFLWSEAFDTWSKQDLATLENKHLDKYNKLVERIEQFLIRKAA